MNAKNYRGIILTLPGGWLSAHLRYQAASTPFVWLWILRYPT